MTYETMLVESKDGIATITLNRSPMSVDLDTGLAIEAAHHKDGPISPSSEGRKRMEGFLKKD